MSIMSSKIGRGAFPISTRLHIVLSVDLSDTFSTRSVSEWQRLGGATTAEDYYGAMVQLLEPEMVLQIFCFFLVS